MVQVNNNFFLAKANLVLQAGATGQVADLTVTGNLWNSELKYSNDTIVIDGANSCVGCRWRGGTILDSTTNNVLRPCHNQTRCVG